jgi:hypothetical protein
MQTKTPDQDMVKLSGLLSEARSLASSRNWERVAEGLDEALAALLRVKPGNGEEPGRIRYQAVDRLRARKIIEPRRSLWAEIERGNEEEAEW